MRLVVATHNPAKAHEMGEVLGARVPWCEILTLAEYPRAPEPEENGATYAENALIKVCSAVAFTGETCVADDAGLEIDALPGELGPQSKRFAGEGTSFAEKAQIILDRMRGLPQAERGARFVCWVSLQHPGAEPRTFHATCEGRIALEPRGEGGFGYDQIFWLPSLGCTMAELTAAQKHAVSHRGKVLRELAVWLEREARPV
ncbi:MAG: RdgB/HAM1 family non-canonical purine NTP pyrophosphatase [Fimbriimonadaceae bacterium]